MILLFFAYLAGSNPTVMKRLSLFLLLTLLLAGVSAQAQETHRFVERDTCSLYLDIFRPADGAETVIDGHAKPTVLFVFGGGFIMGQRSDRFVRPWFERLNAAGYGVVAIDYRLGMKDYQVGKGLVGAYKAVDRFLLSQQIGVEDVFSAVTYLAEHPELGVDTGNLVLSGSSAGAIISLASAYAIANGDTEGLPEGFRFKGVMSFAGAIISNSGAPKFRSAPCPLLMFHGTADGAVAYNHYSALGKGLWGSSYIAAQLQKKGWNCHIWRFEGSTHDVAGYMDYLWPIEKEFLEKDCTLGIARSTDATVTDDSLPKWKQVTMENIY